MLKIHRRDEEKKKQEFVLFYMTENYIFKKCAGEWFKNASITS